MLTNFFSLQSLTRVIRSVCHPGSAQHLSENFCERSAFMAPQWVSSEAWPLSPVEWGFQGSSKASKKKVLTPQSRAPQL
jgi:hypothetical protein